MIYRISTHKQRLELHLDTICNTAVINVLRECLTLKLCTTAKVIPRYIQVVCPQKRVCGSTMIGTHFSQEAYHGRSGIVFDSAERIVCAWD